MNNQITMSSTNNTSIPSGGTQCHREIYKDACAHVPQTRNRKRRRNPKRSPPRKLPLQMYLLHRSRRPRHITALTMTTTENMTSKRLRSLCPRRSKKCPRDMFRLRTQQQQQSRTELETSRLDTMTVTRPRGSMPSSRIAMLYVKRSLSYVSRSNNCGRSTHRISKRRRASSRRRRPRKRMQKNNISLSWAKSTPFARNWASD
jgi:hypothetical protein